MGFLRLGVACAVCDDAVRILLSKRGDLDVWNLPSGRLDSGELLEDAAIREVREETGIEAEITRVVGLYYYQGWQRMNVLFEGQKVGGIIQQATFETRDNRFFALDELPENNISQQMVDDVLDEVISPLRIITMPTDELRRAKLKLRWRWVKNLLRGHIEPRYPRFTVYGCAADYEEHKQKIHGDTPIWEQLKLTETHQLHDIRQNIVTDTLHFIFDDAGTSDVTFSVE